MSLTGPHDVSPSVPAPKTTANTLLLKKRSGHLIAALTAYDFSTARLIDEAGIDVILVGDSLGMAVLGYENTLPVTMEEMLHHARAVGRAACSAFLIADMPYGSYHSSLNEATSNAIRFIKEAGMAAVKIEGGSNRAALVEHLTLAEVPVVGHIGLTPQSLHRMGGYKVQGKSVPSMEALTSDAIALQAAGAVALVLEGIPRELAARITAELSIPTIGIGAGPDCDGQILVFHDLFNLTFSPAAKFVRRYADAARMFHDGISRYREDVLTRSFPSDTESYHLPGKTPGVVDNSESPVLSKA
ncbi:MAG: 3-methyl-2-oxobutanoate hydroxymethyltransferase [Edaphobacter sp.]|nr:3-methyl-2-oxobutanoate hydroxymethyltransferase [Edaphobacter sp.]